MERRLACFEISSDAIKLLIGYELGGQVYCLYKATKTLPGLIKSGRITDPDGLIKALAEFHNVRDEEAKIAISISEIHIVLPPIGLQIYQNDKTTNVIAPNNEIAKIDITNVISLVKKDSIPGDNAIVDIIPDEFVLDNGERYSNPPLGKKSSSLTIKAKIHALPDAIATTFHRLANQSGFRVKKACVSTYCIAELFRSYTDLPQSYLLLDMGGRLTSLSLIGNGSPYSSASFYYGGDDLTEEIAKAFHITFEAAERLKKEYGYNTRKLSFDPPIVNSEDETGALCQFYQADLNAIIEAHYKEFNAKLLNAKATLLAKYGDKYDSFPLLVTGSASLLKGLDTFLSQALPKSALIHPRPRSIGAREPGYSALLGLILASSKYVGSLEDNYHGMGNVSRVPAKKKAKPSSSPGDDAL